MHYVDVELTQQELNHARQVGKARSHYNDHRPDGRISKRLSEHEIDIQGAIAEYAFCKHYGLPWTSRLWADEEWKKRRNDGDVGIVQIKSCARHLHKMIIPKIDPTAIYVLVSLHKLPIAVLSGWCYGKEIPNEVDKALPTPNPSMRQSRLWPMCTFPITEAFLSS